MAGQGNEGPVAHFCAALRRLQQDSGLTRAALARKVREKCGRAQLYQILDGEIRRPPEWDRVVEPVVRACTRNNEDEVGYWRRRHGELITTYEQVRHQDRPHGTSTSADVARVVPAQLPPDVNAFTGRAQELVELDRLLAGGTGHNAVAGANSTAVVISAVSGTAGVGKTALALRWAHRVRDQFPDGQLYVNLRGYDPDQPMTVGTALAGFLRALGIAGQDIPLELDERAGAYRSLLNGRRMLVVLDNAANAEQVRPLLPGTPPCLVVVTSRDSLAGLVIQHGARRIDLDLLPLHDAVALLGALIGKRVEAEPDAATALARHCTRLPLALRVAAERAAARPDTCLASLVGELADEQRRLPLLDAGGDPRTAVRAVFSWSYRHLSADTARVFRLLGLHPGPDLDPYAAAALTDTGHDTAHHLLDVLARAHLIGHSSPGHYGMHDLLRAYATHLATDEDTEQEQRRALTRLFDHYLATAAAAMDSLHPAEQHRRPRIPPPATPTPPVTDPASARAWLDTERAALTTTCAYTAAHGWPSHTSRLAATLFRYLDAGGHYSDALAVHTHALRAARHTVDQSAEARALTNLGVVCWRQGHHRQAADYLQQARDLSREIGDRTGETRTLDNLGLVYWQQGQYQHAAEHFQQALDLFQALGDRDGEAHALDHLGTVYWQQGHYRQAAEHFQQALDLSRILDDYDGEARALVHLGVVYVQQGHYKQAAEHQQQALNLYRQIGNRAGVSHALANLGVVYYQQGQYQQAVEHHLQALNLFREIGERTGEAEALDHLGNVYRRQGQYQQAAEHHLQALNLFGEIGERAGEAKALNGVGETHHAAGQQHDALIQHTVALTLAAQIGDRYEQARAHNGLAHTHHTTGDLDQASYHWHQALDLYTDLAVPEADDVRAHLAALDHTTGNEDR
ncbi:MAG: ATP-binding protein [Pseudonocardiaceae bacterium]